MDIPPADIPHILSSLTNEHVQTLTIDLKTDNLDRVSIPRKILVTFDVEHPIHGTTYGPK